MKIPQTVHSASIRAEAKTSGGIKIYAISLNGAIRNENSSDAMQNVSGVLGIKAPDSETVLLSLPFSIDTILPMASGIIDIKAEMSMQEAAPLLNGLDMDKESLDERGSAESSFIPEEQIIIEKIDFQKKDIVKLLKERI